MTLASGWRHDLILEKILPAEEGAVYPRCLNGKRACPPEDCGGPWGYEDMLRVISDPEDREYKERPLSGLAESLIPMISTRWMSS